MKILYITTISNTVNAFLIPHIKLLVEQGHQVDVAFNTVRDVDPELLKLGCKIHNIEFQRFPLNKSNYKAYKNIKKIVLKEEYDLIHTHTPSASFISRIACRNVPNLNVLYTAHGFHFFKGAPLRNWLTYYPLEKLAARYTDAIITMNQEDFRSAQKMKLRKSNSVYKTHGVGINLNKFLSKDSDEKKNLRKEYGYKNEDFILFYAAELNYNKHQDLLIKAISEIKHKIPQVKLLLAGEGPLMNSYKQEVQRLELNKNVCFLGYRTDIPNLLKLADVAVASSRREGLPVNVMEAMATKLPLVVTDSRGQRDLVKDNKNGFVIDKNDIKGFANAIYKVYKSKDTLIRFSENNIKKIQAYSVGNVVREIKDIYSMIIK